MKKFLFFAGLIIIVIIGAIYWAAGGYQSAGVYPGNITRFNSTQKPDSAYSNKLRVMSWNIAYAYGPNSDNSNYHPISIKTMEEHLQQIASVIRKYNPDIVFLQEVDFDASRSHHVNQLAELAHMTGLEYAAPAIIWKVNYVPFPYWPPQDQFGEINSGGAVLSRYPIESNKVVRLPKPSSNPFWYNMFYLFRFSQVVRVEIRGSEATFINNHLEAYDIDNRIQQAYQLKDLVTNNNDQQPIAVFGGDINTVPYNAKKKSHFADGSSDDYNGDTSLNILMSIKGFREMVPLTDYYKDESKYFTFPSQSPDRRLDYLFVNDNYPILDYGFIKAGTASDHLPVYVDLKWNYPYGYNLSLTN
ncbi:MAG TPA: endonuclease/exonuclease/phosphatase family protein [Balneolales bacterium]|nr:endonuclease/exonuclease/phosphatase family protein [Balneolales bacterium]